MIQSIRSSMQNKKLLVALLIFGAGMAIGIALGQMPIGVGLGSGIGSAYYFNVRPKR
jgi:hypothetical protein